MVDSPGNADLARLQQAAVWDAELVRPAVLPGSAMEEEIIDAIDAARDQHVAKVGSTFARRRQRAYSYWRKKGRHQV